MNYDTKKAVKRLNKLIGYLSDLIMKEEDKEIPDNELLNFLEEKQHQLDAIRIYLNKD